MTTADDLGRLHKAALRRYIEVSAGKANMSHEYAERELASLERALMVPPPGVPPGLITADQARAQATPEGIVELETLSWPAPIPPRLRIRDDFAIIPETDWADVIARKRADEAENRGLVKLSLDQNGFGSCASEGIAGCTMFCEEKQGEDAEPLNAFALYRYVNGGRDGGSSLSDNIAAAIRYGIPTERVWPRSNGWRTPLSDEAKQDALRHRPHEIYRVSDRLEFGTALMLGFVVYCGYSGHAWFAVDLIDTKRFVWKNSWGSDWADNGFSTLAFSEIAWGYGCWAIRTARRAQ